MSNSCSIEGCSDRIRMRGMCQQHGRQAWRNEPAGEAACQECGASFVSTRINHRFCTRSCASRYNHRAPRRTRASALTLAMDSGDPSAILAAIRAAADTTGACWLWPNLNASGYPISSYRRKAVTVHRVALEAHTGGQLGTMQAHHVCGVSACVNPDHLAPATRRENVCEMLERKALHTRIAALEAALRALDPGHPELAWAAPLQDRKV